MLISGAFRVSCVYSICSKLTFERFLLSEVQSMNLFVTPPQSEVQRPILNFTPWGKL
jgi:hypothetical protein